MAAVAVAVAEAEAGFRNGRRSLVLKRVKRDVFSPQRAASRFTRDEQAAAAPTAQRIDFMSKRHVKARSCRALVGVFSCRSCRAPNAGRKRVFARCLPDRGTRHPHRRSDVRTPTGTFQIKNHEVGMRENGHDAPADCPDANPLAIRSRFRTLPWTWSNRIYRNHF